MIIERYIPLIEKPISEHTTPVPLSVEKYVRDWKQSLPDIIPGGVFLGGNYDDNPICNPEDQVEVECKAFNQEHAGDGLPWSCGLQVLPSTGEKYFEIEAKGQEFNDGHYDSTTDTIVKSDGTRIKVADEIQLFESQLNAQPTATEAEQMVAPTPTETLVAPTITSTPEALVRPV